MFEFVEERDGFYVLSDADGVDHMFEVGTLRRVVESVADLDVDDLFAHWRAHHSTAPSRAPWTIRTDEFVEWVRQFLIDPNDADDILFCGDCNSPTHDYDLVSVQDGDHSVCDGCYQSYATCNDCDYVTHQDNLYWIGDVDARVCEGCQDSNYSYCDYCDEYFSHESGHDWEHDDSCDCESPVQSFTIPNDGHDPLKNDTPVSLSIPAGTISEAGIEQIQRLIQTKAMLERNAVFNGNGIYDYDPRIPAHIEAQDRYCKLSDVSYAVTTLDPQWQTRQGNFTRRLSSLAYKSHGVKLSPDMISEIGNIGSQHSQGNDFNIEFTRDLNLSAAQFGHEDSCYWQSYGSSRCTLKTNAGIGMRSFNNGGKNENAYGDGVTGRAWLVPLRSSNGSLVPTYETMTPDAWVVFNGYGDLSGYAPARLVAHMVGMTYRKIEFTFGEAYINAGGYLIAPEEIAQSYTDGALHIRVQPHSDLYDREVAAGTVKVAA